MAASAGTLVGRTKAGKSVLIDLYIPDAVDTYLGFNTNGLAGTASETQHIVAEDMVIEDITIAAAPTAVGAALVKNSGRVNGAALRWANQLSSLNNRTKLAIGVRAGDQIRFQQF